jgi:hypothetical protein
MFEELGQLPIKKSRCGKSGYLLYIYGKSREGIE